MGIVVCISMFLGILLFLPRPWESNRKPAAAPQASRKQQSLVAQLLLLTGAWNILWYGAQHLASFWGNAALLSGVFMVLAAIILAAESSAQPNQHLHRVYVIIRPLRLLIFTGLSASFLLYAVTLIQLNVGYPIIR